MRALSLVFFAENHDNRAGARISKKRLNAAAGVWMAEGRTHIWRVAIAVAVGMCCIISSYGATTTQPSAVADLKIPLTGQQIGAPSDDVPVYISVGLDKLLAVDEISYRFEASLGFLMDWRDKEAAKNLFAGDVATKSRLSAALNSTSQCVSNLNFPLTPDAEASSVEGIIRSPGDGRLSQCENAAFQFSDDKKTCLRYCDPEEPFMCCDSIWIPGFQLPNLVGITLDKARYDRIDSYPHNGTTFLVRGTEFQGVFSTPLKFHRFPFDKQRLQIQINTRGGSYHIMKSMLFRGRLRTAESTATTVRKAGKGITSDSDAHESDELAGWRLTGMDWQCMESVMTPDFTEVVGAYEVYGDPHDSDDFYNWGRDIVKDCCNSSPDEGLGEKSNTPPYYTSCIVYLNIRRNHWFSFWQLVFPTMLPVLLSFAPLWSEPTDIDVRLGTAVSLFLALVALQFTTTSTRPRSSYLTDFHYLIIFSYFTMGLIVIENVLVYHICNSPRHIRHDPDIASGEAAMEADSTASKRMDSEAPDEMGSLEMMRGGGSTRSTHNVLAEQRDGGADVDQVEPARSSWPWAHHRYSRSRRARPIVQLSGWFDWAKKQQQQQQRRLKYEPGHARRTAFYLDRGFILTLPAVYVIATAILFLRR